MSLPQLESLRKGLIPTNMRVKFLNKIAVGGEHVISQFLKCHI